MRKVFVIVCLVLIVPLYSSSQIISDSISYIKSRTSNVVEMNDFNLKNVIDGLQGCLCDPVILNELGITLITSTNSPNFGLGLDLNPLFLNKLKMELLYRHNLNKDYIITSGIESKYLFRKLPIDFRIEYNGYNLLETSLNNYHKYLAGVIYRKRASIGLFIGQDNYDDKRKIGYEVLLDYVLRKETGKCCTSYKSTAEINASIGYWGEEINYKIKIDYFLNYSIRGGIGYEKLYDLSEVCATFRYLIHY